MSSEGDYDVLQMCIGSYKLPLDEAFAPPAEWYVAHEFFPNGAWDLGVVIYERIRSIEPEVHCTPGTPAQRENENHPEYPNREIALARVEWCVAFRGTVPTSAWNWLINLGLFRSQKPVQALVGFETIAQRNNKYVTTFRKIGKDVDDMESITTAGIMHLADLDKKGFVEANKSQLSRLWKANKSVHKHILQITFTGHSLGAVMAIVRCVDEQQRDCGASPKMYRAVVFDSPGAAPLLSASQTEWAKAENANGDANVVSYLSAPNLVNTLHPHVGTVIRLYVPHVRGTYLRSTNNLLALCEMCIKIGTACVGVATFLDIRRNGTGPSSANPEKEKNSITEASIVSLSVASLLVAASRIAMAPLRALIFDAAWLLNQHGVANYLSCFHAVAPHAPKVISNPHIRKQANLNGVVIPATTWPGFWKHNFGNRLERFCGFMFAPYYYVYERGVLDVLDDLRAEATIEECHTLR
jgi:hypothetical protein